MKRILRLLSGLMLVFFALCTVVQYNDPDPYLWMPLYGLAAVWSAVFLFKRKVPKTAVGIFIAGCLVWMLYLSGVLAREGDFTLQSEEFREFLGLVITAVWSALLWMFSLKYGEIGRQDNRQ